MTFVYHHRTAGRGGEGHHIMSVVTALEKDGHEVTIVSPPGIDPRAAVGMAPLDKADAHAVGLNRLWRWVSRRCPQVCFEFAELAYNAWACVQVGRTLRREPGAPLYERYALFMVAGAVLAGLFRRRLVLEVNEVAGLARARGLVLGRLARQLERYVFSRSDEIITVSSYLRDEILERGGTPGHVHVIPNAIDPARFGPAAAGQALRARLNLANRIVVGFVGWFDKWDRLELLVEMCRDLRQSHPQLSLLLVGDGPVVANLRALTERYGLQDVVHITGAQPRDSIIGFIDAMDICVLPDSNMFGSPLVLFEFMARGRAIVAADVPPVRDVVRHGINGLIVRRGDLAQLTRTVGDLAADAPRREALGNRAKSIVFERHTWAATAVRVVELASGTTSAPQVEVA
jgi:glycosyltransferase involved in cell wall biosynthesis